MARMATIGRNQAVADLHVVWLWGFFGLVRVADRTPDVARSVSESAAGAHSMGLELFHSGTRGAADHGHYGVATRHRLCSEPTRPKQWQEVKSE